MLARNRHVYNPTAMTNASNLADKFASGLPYGRYLQTGTEEQQRRWTQVYDAAHLTDDQKQLVAGFVREMKILIFSGIWCGDCVQQCPLISRIAEVNPGKIDLRFVERPKESELVPELRINTGSRVPVVIFLSEDNEWCATAGDRTINRYRALARARLGPLCPTGIVAPEKDELDATLADWLNEVERVQLMLRLTPRLRQKYQD
jgi:thiol-disulfide isomerase/thioredoxin